MLVLALGIQPATAQTCAAPDPIGCNQRISVTPADCVSDESGYACTGTAYPGADHVYEITPAVGTEFFVDIKPATVGILQDNDLDVFLQTGGCGPAASCLASGDTGFDDHLSWTADGSTYNISIDKAGLGLFGTDACLHDYVIQVGCPEPCDPVTDVAQVLTCSTDLIGEDTATGTDVLDYYECGSPFHHLLSRNNERIYEFTATASGDVTVQLDNMTTDHDIYVLEDVCDQSGCIEGSTNEATTTDSVTFTAVAGRTYYIVVEAFNGVGTYDLDFINVGGCPEDCDDGFDNDVDGDVDCDDSDCIPDPICCHDDDADGYYDATCGGDDCNDADPNIHPGAAEITCDGFDNDCNVGTPDAQDLDSDGVTNCSDCDDNDGNNYPGNPEVCDGVDNDCDFLADEGLGILDYWPDADGDGRGDASASPVASCSGAPAGNYVLFGDDCDDTDPLNYPTNVETCDGQDNDCDGTPDDGLVFLDWYLDIDSDGHGGATGLPITTCDGAPNALYVLSNDDCNDFDSLAFPGNPEQCDGRDNDCDNEIDEGIVFVDYYLDIDGDGFGGASSPAVSACDGAPASHVANNTDCNDLNANINPNAAEVPCDGFDNDCAVSTEDEPDADGDGSSVCIDCDDADPNVSPSFAEATCDGLDNDCDPTTEDEPDGDGDGASVCVDCDDADANVSPLFAEVACDGFDNDCDPTTEDSHDIDLDGVTDCFDCDDADANNFPTNLEICDGADNDCSGLADDGLSFVDHWPDLDGDAFGDPLGTILSVCDGTTPPDHVDNDLDCDDSDGDNFPTNPEVCDGADNDCTGLADDGLAFVIHWPDLDGDTFGDPTGIPVATCDGPPIDHVADDQDCDDTDPTVYPGALEIPGDGVDQDCSGVEDCYLDGDLDGIGGPVVVAGLSLDCLTTGQSPVDTDCDDADGANYPGNAELCDAQDNNCDGQIDEASVFSDYWPDVDGDGFGDVAGSALSTCDGAPANHVTDATDCDDTDAAVHPDATEALCTGTDEDCDPGTEDDPDLDGDADGVCTDCDDADPFYNLADLDNDGFTTCALDCDDLDPGRYPGAPELADGIDNDCDTAVDEGTTWTDDDGDGYAEAGGDCDDGDPGVNPGAIEVCDTVDQDCNGLVDDGTECYDDDGDGASELQGDCNDADPLVNPGAAEDLGNGIDDDCDGITDDGAGDLDGDGWTGEAGDCDDDDATLYPGAVEICDGRDQDCNGTIDDGTDCFDDDGDGVTEVDGDCDDQDDTVYADADEIVDGVDNDCDGLVDEGTEVADDDGDGVSELAGDCDDANPDVFPGAEETANGIDDDCDLAIDELTEDLDGDGYSSGSGDCDDTDGWINPVAPEWCDGIDNNCNGILDDGCLEPETGSVGSGGGCGCGQGTAAGFLGAWPAALLLLALRRRRRTAA